jgi:hypothetical protein
VFLGNLEGVYLFLDCWVDAVDSQNLMPIPSLIYEVTIHREVQPTPVEEHAYIDDVFIYDMHGEAVYLTVQTGPDNTSIVFVFYVKPSNFLASGQSFGNNTVANANLIKSRLQNFYDSLNLRVGHLTFNMFTDILEAEVHTYDADSNWKECTATILDVPEAKSFSDITAEITSITPNGHDALLVDASGV